MKHIPVIFFLLTLSGCYSDVKNVSITGLVMDLQSKKPIVNAEISVICWKYGNTSDDSYTASDTAIVYSDEKGLYKCSFSSGAFVAISAIGSGYARMVEATELYHPKNVIDLKLKAL